MSIHHTSRSLRLANAMLLLLGLGASMVAQAGPDFTRGEQAPERAKHDWNLGALGARGWMHTEKLTTETARQVLVTKIDPAGPAAKTLKPGDVVLGVDGKPFDNDPRTVLGLALTAAESRSGRGRIRLLRWRKGRKKTVTVRMPVLGDYAQTAPYGNCKKSKAILERGCAALAERMQQSDYKQNPIPRALNALALLATGDQRYHSLVAREARWAAEFEADGFQTWYYGYVGILLGEYILATGDESVRSGLKRIMLSAAQGQSRVGSWGHRFAGDDGRLLGYGMMNSPGIPLTIALVLARKAGVDDPRIEVAIQRSLKLLRFYAGKGAVPYGDHDPWMQTHEDNGKCGMAAVLFNLVGDVEAAEFFARMSLASHGAERDCGHTGNFFNVLWAMPAIALFGPHATGAWMEEFGARYFDLARRPDGTFVHLGAPQERNDKYARWDASGALLLAYALPARRLTLTGKTRSQLQELSRADAERVIAAGRGWSNRNRHGSWVDRSRAELIAGLKGWSPIVRERAAMELRRRRDQGVDTFITMLQADDLNSRYGACVALGNLRGAAAPAIPKLLATLEADDLWLRVQAARALAGIGKPAVQAVPALLERLARQAPPDDPRGMEQRYLCSSLFDRRSGLMKHALDAVDQKALRTAVRAGLQNEDGRARSNVSNIYMRLTWEQIEPLMPAILEAIEQPAPSGVMFADGVRTAGLKVLAKHRVRNGLEAAVRYLIDQKKHGSEKRVPKVLDLVKSYGAHARDVVPQLEAVAKAFDAGEEKYPKRLSLKKALMVRDAIAEIHTLKDRPELIRLR